MDANARGAVDLLYHIFSGGEFWRTYVAFSLLVIAAVVVLLPRAGFGIDRFQAIVKYHRLSPAAQTRLERVLLADYGNGSRSRLAAYAFAILAVVLAGLCAVPAIPPTVIWALGILGATWAAVIGLTRQRAEGRKRGAELVPRRLPRPLLVIGICDVVAMLCFAIDPAMRAGRAADPALEAAVASFVRADQALTIASCMMSITILCSAMIFTSASRHLSVAGITREFIYLGAMLPVFVAALCLRSVSKARDFKPLASVLEAAPL